LGSFVATLVLLAVHVLTPVSGLRRTPPRWRRPDALFLRSSMIAASCISSIAEPRVSRGRPERPCLAWLSTNSCFEHRGSVSRCR